MSNLKKIDWTKPLEHTHGVPIEYVGERSQRNGQAITDGCVHLLICGIESSATYVDEYGRVPKKRDDKGAVIQWLTICSEKAPEPAKPRSLDEAMGDLTSAVDALRDVAQTEGVNLRKLMHTHLTEMRGVTERYIAAMSKQSSGSQDDFLAALKLASEGLHQTIVAAVSEAIRLGVDAALEAREAREPVVPPVAPALVRKH